MNKHISDIGTKKVLQCLSGLLNTKQDAMSEMTILEMMSLWEGDDEEVKYSFDERIVGTWVNGKPLYEKTLLFEDLTAGETRAHELEDLDQKFIYVSFVEAANYSDTNTVAMLTNDGQHFLIDDENIMWAGQNLSQHNGNAYVVVRYTKKLDNAKK